MTQWSKYILDRLFKFEIFFTSFLPLWLLIVINNVWDIINNYINVKSVTNIQTVFLYYKCELIFTLFILSCSIVTIVKIVKSFKKLENKSNRHKCLVKNVHKKNNLTSEYLIFYILPNVAFDFSNVKDLVIFSVYFGLLAFLCIRNNNLYINILLELLGYKIYMCNIICTITGSEEVEYLDCLILSRIDITMSCYQKISYFAFENDIYINLDKGR